MKTYIAISYEDRIIGVSKFSQEEFNDAIMVFPKCTAGDRFHMQTVYFPIGIMALDANGVVLDKAVMAPRNGGYIAPSKTHTIVETSMNLFDDYKVGERFGKVEETSSTKKIVERNANPLAQKTRKKLTMDFDKMLDKEDKNLADKERKAQLQEGQEQAEVNLEQAEKRSSKAEVERVVERYKMIMELSKKDGNRWVDYYNNNDAKGFIENVEQYSSDDWADIVKKLDTVLEDLNSVIIG